MNKIILIIGVGVYLFALFNIITLEKNPKECYTRLNVDLIKCPKANEIDGAYYKWFYILFVGAVTIVSSIIMGERKSVQSKSDNIRG